MRYESRLQEALASKPLMRELTNRGFQVEALGHPTDNTLRLRISPQPPPDLIPKIQASSPNLWWLAAKDRLEAEEKVLKRSLERAKKMRPYRAFRAAHKRACRKARGLAMEGKPFYFSYLAERFDPRTLRMLEMKAQGATLSAIGKKVKLSAERCRQVISKAKRQYSFGLKCES